jgi:uncharacterized protein YacL
MNWQRPETLVLPGETMVVKAIKEGKEPGQGVAYLDDGTIGDSGNGKPIFKAKRRSSS